MFVPRTRLDKFAFLSPALPLVLGVIELQTEGSHTQECFFVVWPHITVPDLGALSRQKDKKYKLINCFCQAIINPFSLCALQKGQTVFLWDSHA
jgi:hypothetical protein